MHDTLPLLEEITFPTLTRSKVTTLQVNLGYLCNQTCLHCHVNAGPKRTEQMTGETITGVLKYLKTHKLDTLDLTGGAPEMHDQFRYLVSEAHELGIRIIDRCNLTILDQPGYDDLGGFLANNKVEIIASLPCYLGENVDAQRGKGVFNKSIRALQHLNSLGYGTGALSLSLVYNPQGPVLPPEQQGLMLAYKEELEKYFDVQFDDLLVITNMPINRFGSMLVSKGLFDDYIDLLRNNHQESNLDSLMCRSVISIDWQGYVYDCDFNQMLELPLAAGIKKRVHLSDILEHDIEGKPIRVSGHCYGCSAGQGSSCSGALNDASN